MKIVQILFFFFLLGLTAGRAATVLTVGGTSAVVKGKILEFPHSPSDTGFYENRLSGGSPFHSLSFYVFTPGHLRDWQITFTAAGPTTSMMSNLVLGIQPAQRFANVNMMGLAISGDGYSVSGGTGWVNILELSWTANNLPDRVAIDFYITDFGDKFTQGSLRFNSNIPVGQVPEPGTTLLTLGTLLGLTRRRR